MLKKYKDFLIISFILIITSCLFIYSNEIKLEILRALHIFVNALFPSMFPIFLLVNMLIEYNFVIILSKYFKFISNKIFHINESCSYVIIMSLISGFPSGAKYTKILLDKGLINLNEANYLITFTNFSNPLFIINVVNIIFNNKVICFKILLAHYLANFIIALVTRPKEIPKDTFSIKSIKTESFSKALTTSLNNTYQVLFLILGSTIFMFITSFVIINIFNLNGSLEILTNGLLDISKAVISLNKYNSNILFKEILITSFLSFSSFSVHLQVASILNNSKIHYHNFFLGRICQIGISILLIICFHNL